MTCVLLHDFLRKSESSRNIYTPPDTIDSIVNGQHVDGFWRQNHTDSSAIRLIPHVTRLASNNNLEIRYEFADYFHNSN